MMLSRLIEKARKKGYTVAKIPERVFGFTLPEWFSFEWVFISPKRTHYTPEAFARKMLLKRVRRAIKHRKSIIRELLKNDIHPQNPYF